MVQERGPAAANNPWRSRRFRRLVRNPRTSQQPSRQRAPTSPRRGWHTRLSTAGLFPPLSAPFPGRGQASALMDRHVCRARRVFCAYVSVALSMPPRSPKTSLALCEPLPLRRESYQTFFFTVGYGTHVRCRECALEPSTLPPACEPVTGPPKCHAPLHPPRSTPRPHARGSFSAYPRRCSSSTSLCFVCLPCHPMGPESCPTPVRGSRGSPALPALAPLVPSVSSPARARFYHAPVYADAGPTRRDTKKKPPPRGLSSPHARRKVLNASESVHSSTG